ncbi:MAG: type I methionyl aminopeptidase [Deltaproteobacteria bacterium]|nr:type I methionyl aminopeptidase [Deltaproteobacteria bacterium]
MALKNEQEIALMRSAGRLLWETHQAGREMIRSGVTTQEIDRAIEDFIVSHHAEPLFKGVPGKVPFPASSCISINEEVVHGIPSATRKLAEGDIVSIDIGLRLKGWCADAACTYPVGDINAEKRKLLEVTENCLRIAIQQLKEKTRWRHIARKMQRHAEAAGFSVIEDLVGHGIGTEMWERPQVPNYFTNTLPDFHIKPGLVIAIEPMINRGGRDIRQLSDHWTIVSRDGLPSAHFEHTVAITENGPEVLTCGPNGEGWGMP